MVALVLKLLGDFEARDGAGRRLAVKARKNRALLAALALAPSHSMSRQHLASLLWSDRSDDQARSSLRQALVQLRRELASSDPSLLSITEARVAINPALVEIDAANLQRLAAFADVTALRQAAVLCRGELLADTYVADPSFEIWLASERQRLGDIAIAVLEKLCALETGAARIEVAKRLVALDPLREASHRTLMQVYFDAGKKGWRCASTRSAATRCAMSSA